MAQMVAMDLVAPVLAAAGYPPPSWTVSDSGNGDGSVSHRVVSTSRVLVDKAFST